VKLILGPIWEADFLPSSFGYRPGRSVHDALEVLRVEANRGADWVLEADVSNAFEASSHSLPGSCNLIKEAPVGANYVDA
jgi:RNA-directed DNA polymerase